MNKPSNKLRILKVPVSEIDIQLYALVLYIVYMIAGTRIAMEYEISIRTLFLFLDAASLAPIVIHGNYVAELINEKFLKLCD